MCDFCITFDQVEPCLSILLLHNRVLTTFLVFFFRNVTFSANCHLKLEVLFLLHTKRIRIKRQRKVSSCYFTVDNDQICSIAVQ